MKQCRQLFVEAEERKKENNDTKKLLSRASFMLLYFCAAGLLYFKLCFSSIRLLESIFEVVFLKRYQYRVIVFAPLLRRNQHVQLCSKSSIKLVS